jgi:DNA polymerase I-like protein with 3'-5' exonuclease and polymerase domains
MSGRRSYAERQAVNTVVQGSAADMVKQAMVHVSLALEGQGMSGRARMCLQIHDEILLEVVGRILIPGH